MKGLIKLFDEANSYMSKNSAQFLDFEGNNVKKQVSLLYRLFDGKTPSSTSIDKMKEFLEQKHITKESADFALGKLSKKITELHSRLAELSEEETGSSNEPIELGNEEDAETDHPEVGGGELDEGEMDVDLEE